MKAFMTVIGSLLPSIVLCYVATAGQDTAKPAETKKKADVAPSEKSVVDYESKTQGALQVKSASKNPGDFFDVLRSGKRAYSGVEPLLDSTLELPPGAYVVVLNRTERKVTIEAGKKTILLSGDLMVTSKRENTYWVPKQGKETRLALNPPVVNRRVALFPGAYDVYINTGTGTNLRPLGKADVKPGKLTVVRE